MFENRRYTRYDVSQDKIEVQMYDVDGFSFLGYIKDISRGGLQFTTKTPIRWKENETLTLYLILPNENRVTSIDVRPIRSKRKLFKSYHAGEFVGSVVAADILAPILEMKEQKELARA